MNQVSLLANVGSVEKKFTRKDKICILKYILIVLNMSAIFVIRSTREETLCRATSIKSIKKIK